MSGKEKGKGKLPLRRRYTLGRQLASDSQTRPSTQAPPSPQPHSEPRAPSQPHSEPRAPSQPHSEPRASPQPLLQPRVERRSVSTHQAPAAQSQPDSTPQISDHDPLMSDQDVSGDSYPSCDADTQNSMTGRHTLTLDKDGFLPSLVAANTLKEIIRGYYVQPWTTWTEIPYEVRTTWFEEFMRKHTITPHDDSWARKNFEHRGALSLKNNFEKVRKRMRRPTWLGESVWDSLVRHWQSVSFKKQSVVAKSNRTSGGSADPTHTGGSITISQHRENLTKLHGTPPSVSELFRHTHIKKKDQTFVSSKAGRMLDEFNNEMTQHSQSASNNGGNPPNETEVWVDIAGIKKGKVYGLRSESAQYGSQHRFCGSSSTLNDMARRVENL